jgi:hypothetical protein
MYYILYITLDDEYHLFFYCNINANIRVTFLKYFKETHYYFNNFNIIEIYIYIYIILITSIHEDI